jgi:hypothetical protein
MSLTKKSRGNLPIVGTQKQELATDLLSENLRRRKPEPMGAVLRKAGYSIEQSKRPSDITNSVTFQQLLEKKLGDKFLLNKHKKLIDAGRLEKFIFPNAVSDAEIRETINGVKGGKLIKIVRNPQWARAYYMVPDNITQTKVLELAYKLKRYLGNDVPEGDDGYTEEIRAVIVRIRKVLPPAGQ